MQETIVNKLMEMIKSDIMSVSIRVFNDDKEAFLSFKYDKEKDCIDYEYYVNENKVNRGVVKTSEEVVSIVEQSTLLSEVTEYVQSRIDKEERFKALKVEMTDKLNEMNLSEEQMATMISVIEITTQLSDIVGMGNRVYLNATSDYWEHVRVTDRTRWSDTGENLHLQLVQAMEDPEGVKHHNYPQYTFEELVGRILESPLVEKIKSGSIKHK